MYSIAAIAPNRSPLYDYQEKLLGSSIQIRVKPRYHHEFPQIRPLIKSPHLLKL